MKKQFAVILVALVACGSGAPGWSQENQPRGPEITASQDGLANGFDAPPLSARLRAYWWWLNGNVDKAAITKDLEWMKKIGMGGGLIFDAGGPAGPTPTGPTFASPQWRDLFVHAVKEAHRLGLALSLSPQSGWNLGGPVVTPEDAALQSSCRVRRRRR
jgi:hypothetical protein